MGDIYEESLAGPVPLTLFASLPLQWVTYMKSLWRDQYLAPDDSCGGLTLTSEDDNDLTKCSFSCDSSKGVEMMAAFEEM